MAKNYKEYLIKRKIKRPSKLIAFVAMPILGKLCKKANATFSYDYDVKQLNKQQVIVVCGHATRLEFVYSLYGLKRKDVNVVCGFQNIYSKGLYRLLCKAGVIAKYLYQPDFGCVKNILSVLRRGGSIVLYPEGIQSTSGSTQPINPATCRLLKKAKVTVLLCKSQGTYLRSSRYSKDVKQGAVQVHYSVLFTPQQLEQSTEKDIYDKLLKEFAYNEYEANRVNRVAFRGKLPNIDGLDNIIYKCPHCQQEFTLSVSGSNMVCSNCQFECTMNDYYDLLPVNGALPFVDVDQWHKWQRKTVFQQVRQPNFSMQASGALYTIRPDKLPKSLDDYDLVAKGNVVLDGDGLHLSGEQGNFNFGVNNLYSLTIVVGKGLEFYYKDDFYLLVLDVPNTQLSKWNLASEELHNLHDELWLTACKDVFDYE